ncbi:hypothetical protein RGU72_04995 [Undibacterium sp. 5I1]|uniref:hypothetical protein n=1 Tax=unclassified Undibacterium TaxID=2630295 RepID=UPI002AB4FE51|nr:MULTISPECIES: hypothetical protein [unclassified Undibacterium]MDY7537610.1 hypothetical protein [Undibacterium sp. 5I1]MEB0230155.1 hypothetical protein [Undibacterium sp. 10I3]MEB0256347.1 hypothetical protein [Undibacterium sp. 5I1]
MDIFLAGTAVNLITVLSDKSGNPLKVTSIEYRISDESGTELVPLQALSGFVAESPQAVIEVSAENNIIADTAASGLRAVELHCVVAGNTIVINTGYIVELADPLVVGTNSFQTYAQAEFNAVSLPNLAGWDKSSESERMAALSDARDHIVQLSFTQLNSNVNWGQDSLNFVPEGTYSTNYVSNGDMFLFNGNLALLTPLQFSKLPDKFKLALSKAQIVEADSILGGNVVDSRRREGLLLESIGEVKQMYRSGKPLDLPVSRRALSYLSYFVTFSKKVGR